jgi:hypothetical protein
MKFTSKSAQSIRSKIFQRKKADDLAAEEAAPDALVQLVADVASLVKSVGAFPAVVAAKTLNTVNAALPGTAVQQAARSPVVATMLGLRPTPAALPALTMPNITALETEKELLAAKTDGDSVRRRAAVEGLIRENVAALQNGGAGGPPRIVQLRTELASLAGLMDQTSCCRKFAIGKELRELRSMPSPFQPIEQAAA